MLLALQPFTMLKTASSLLGRLTVSSRRSGAGATGTALRAVVGRDAGAVRAFHNDEQLAVLKSAINVKSPDFLVRVGDLTTRLSWLGIAASALQHCAGGNGEAGTCCLLWRTDGRTAPRGPVLCH